jgi:hypothetical protein
MRQPRKSRAAPGIFSLFGSGPRRRHRHLARPHQIHQCRHSPDAIKGRGRLIGRPVYEAHVKVAQPDGRGVPIKTKVLDSKGRHGHAAKYHKGPQPKTGAHPLVPSKIPKTGFRKIQTFSVLTLAVALCSPRWTDTHRAHSSALRGTVHWGPSLVVQWQS